MIFDTDAVPCCTNVALHKFSNDPGLSFKPKSTMFAYSVLLYKTITSIQGFCAFSLEKPLVSLQEVQLIYSRFQV